MGGWVKGAVTLLSQSQPGPVESGWCSVLLFEDAGVVSMASKQWLWYRNADRESLEAKFAQCLVGNEQYETKVESCK